MRMVDLIEKRDSHILTEEEIHFIIEGYTRSIAPIIIICTSQFNIS